MYNIVFMGTPAIAVPTLEALVAHPECNVLAVCTSPDKPVGRKQILTAPPVKQCAEKHSIPVYQPKTLKKNDEHFELLSSMDIDFFVVIAYGFIIPQRFLDIPNIYPINVHGSLLPKYRGASPIQASLLHGEAETGITFMVMNSKMDEGDMLRHVTIPIEHRDTSGSVFEKLGLLSGEHICQTLIDTAQKTLHPIPQDNSLATTCSLISKNDGQCDPLIETAVSIYRKWQAYTPWPGVSISYQNFHLSLKDIELSEHSALQAGEISPMDEKLFLGTIDGDLELIRVQKQGKKEMSALEWWRGTQHSANS